MRNQAAAVKKALKAMRLGDEHEALKAYCIGLAEVIDANPKSPGLWGEYRQALDTLLSVAEVGETDGQAALLRLVSTPVGDSETTGTEDAGAGSGGTGEDLESSAVAVAADGGGCRPGVAS